MTKQFVHRIGVFGRDDDTARNAQRYRLSGHDERIRKGEPNSACNVRDVVAADRAWKVQGETVGLHRGQHGVVQPGANRTLERVERIRHTLSTRLQDGFARKRTKSLGSPREIIEIKDDERGGRFVFCAGQGLGYVFFQRNQVWHTRARIFVGRASKRIIVAPQLADRSDDNRPQPAELDKRNIGQARRRINLRHFKISREINQDVLEFPGKKPGCNGGHDR